MVQPVLGKTSTSLDETEDGLLNTKKTATKPLFQQTLYLHDISTALGKAKIVRI